VLTDADEPAFGVRTGCAWMSPQRRVTGMLALMTRMLWALVIAGWFAYPATAQTRKLRYGQAYSAAHSIFSLPVSIAQHAGLFDREGLDVQIVIPVPGGAEKMIEAMNDGWVDVTHIATPFLIQSALAGSDAVAIDAEFNSAIYSLVTKSAIKSYADLKGKTIGLADERGTITISMRKLLAQHGLDRESYLAKTLDGTPQRSYCLLHGDCDAVVLGQPQDFQALAQGYRLLGRSDEAVPGYLYTVTAVRRSWADAHRETLVRFVRAMAASFHFIRDPANREDVIRVIAESTGCSDAIAAQTLDLFLAPGGDVLPKRGEMGLNALTQVIGMMGEAGQLKPPLPEARRFVDLQYLHAAGVE
jgi:ABC-type nitrate/sulfonate/bicarbonate transport system substrate-binding protein